MGRAGVVGKGRGGGSVGVGYLWSNYECFPISGCKDILENSNTEILLLQDVLDFDL